MTTRVLLSLFALFSAFLPACGADDASFGGDRQLAAGTTNQTESSESGSDKNAQGGSGAAAPVAARGGASAGSSVAAPGAGAGSNYGLGSAPVTWNSAKTATLDDAQLQSAYSTWKLAHVEACANGSAVVVNGDAVVSEGIAYGMLLSVAMSDQALFDALFKYYQDHADKNGLMNWKTQKCEAPGNNNTNAATDADLDAAMALVQAAARWPSAPTGYLSKAETLAAKIIQFETDMCDGRRILRPGDSFGGCSDTSYRRIINPSYFSPGYYKVFAHYFSSQAATWLALSDASYQLYAFYQAHLGALVPDWSSPDGNPTELPNDGLYWYDACRTPWRVAVDYAWSGDTRAKTFMQNISSWVDAHGGLPKAAQQQNSAFIGAFALAGSYDQGKFDGYMSGWLGAKLDDTPYYQGTLRVLYLLVAAGKFSSTL